MSSPTSRKAGETINADDALLLIGGSDGTASRALAVDANGKLVLLAGNTGAVPIALSTDTLGGLKHATTVGTLFTPVTSPAAPGTAVGVAVSIVGYRSISGLALIQGATGGTLDVFIQTSFDNGVTWVDCVHFTQLAAAGAQVAWAFAIDRGTAPAAPVAVNTASGTPSLAANTIAAGVLGTHIRYALVAGTLTTAGASQTIQTTHSG